MASVISVRFKENGKVYYFDPLNYKISTDDSVVVETARGTECGKVTAGIREVPDSEISHPLKPVLRVANEKDLETIKRNAKKEKDAFKICEEKILEHKLEMKLVEVDYTFDGSKILFYFISDGRIDFRELVKDLASVFKTRIELRQIGVRDEAKMIGGLGICGKEFCCKNFMSEFHPVSIKMAKDQGLSLNPTKISGTCGRLMCCLKFEQNSYEDLIKITPRHGSTVSTPDGMGKVIDANLISGEIRVILQDNPDVPKTYHRSVIKQIRNFRPNNGKSN